MGRPKASDRSKHISCSFANSVTYTRIDERDGHRIECKGPNSIFSLLSTCLPELVRESRDLHPVNRTGVSEVELNKFLTSSGFIPCRERHRISSSNMTKWSKGIKRWSNRRWIDPRRPGDLFYLNTRFAEMYELFPETRVITVSGIVQFLLVLSSQGPSEISVSQCMTPKVNSDDDCGSLSDQDNEPKELCVKRKHSDSPPCGDNALSCEGVNTSQSGYCRKFPRRHVVKRVEEEAKMPIGAVTLCPSKYAAAFSCNPISEAELCSNPETSISLVGKTQCSNTRSSLACNKIDEIFDLGVGSGDETRQALMGVAELIHGHVEISKSQNGLSSAAIWSGSAHENGSAEKDDEALSKLSGEACNVLALVSRFYNYVPGQSTCSIDDVLHNNQLVPLLLPALDTDAESGDFSRSADGGDMSLSGCKKLGDLMGGPAVRRDKWEVRSLLRAQHPRLLLRILMLGMYAQWWLCVPLTARRVVLNRAARSSVTAHTRVSVSSDLTWVQGRQDISQSGRSGLLSLRVWRVPRPPVPQSRCLRFHNPAAAAAPAFAGCPPWARVILNFCYAVRCPTYSLAPPHLSPYSQHPPPYLAPPRRVRSHPGQVTIWTQMA